MGVTVGRRGGGCDRGPGGEGVGVTVGGEGVGVTVGRRGGGCDRGEERGWV